MTVTWKQTALDGRVALLTAALARAIEIPDPQIYIAALEQDDRIEAEGDALDGVVTDHPGPAPGTRLYTCQGGRHVLIYAREDNDALILALAPARSNWKQGQ